MRRLKVSTLEDLGRNGPSFIPGQKRIIDTAQALLQNFPVYIEGQVEGHFQSFVAKFGQHSMASQSYHHYRS